MAGGKERSYEDPNARVGKIIRLDPRKCQEPEKGPGPLSWDMGYEMWDGEFEMSHRKASGTFMKLGVNFVGLQNPFPLTLWKVSGLPCSTFLTIFIIPIAYSIVNVVSYRRS